MRLTCSCELFGSDRQMPTPDGGPASRLATLACMTLSIENLFSVAGKTVLVTGGSRGIGEMIAAGFLANGAKVYISSRKAQVCDATAARLSETSGGTCVSIPADLSTVDGRRPRSPPRSRVGKIIWTCW